MKKMLILMLVFMMALALATCVQKGSALSGGSGGLVIGAAAVQQ